MSQGWLGHFFGFRPLEGAAGDQLGFFRGSLIDDFLLGSHFGILRLRYFRRCGGPLLDGFVFLRNPFSEKSPVSTSAFNVQGDAFTWEALFHRVLSPAGWNLLCGHQHLRTVQALHGAGEVDWLAVEFTQAGAWAVSGICVPWLETPPQPAILPSCHPAMLPSCHPAILPSCHPAILPCCFSFTAVGVFRRAPQQSHVAWSNTDR